MNSNNKSRGKYTIGPHGEIYNNQPVISERTRKMMEMLVLQDAFNEAFNSVTEEEENENEDSGTPEGTD